MMTSKEMRMESSRNRYHQMDDGDTTDGQDQQEFLVRVDNRFLFLSLLSCILLAFAVGRMARISLIINPNEQYFQFFLKQQEEEQEQKSNSINQKSLPTPILGAGKEIPHTEYSSKTFDTARSVSIDSRWVVVTDPHSSTSTTEQQQQNEHKSFSSSDKENDGSQHQTQKELQSCYDDAEDAEHLPEGEHLLIDIANVAGEFLRSEERLSNAMLTLINDVGLTLLSYHCHEMTSSGVHCAGILLESHISFHTFPNEGVITLDLFTCGTAKLLPVLPIVEELFAIPSKSNIDDDQKVETEATTINPKTQMIWAFKYRGFSDHDPTDAQELTDLFDYPVGQMIDYKKQIAAVQTEYQRIEVYDVIERLQSYSSYEKSMNTNEPSFESLHPAYFLPDRQIFLDGILQSRRFGENPYHEALVHPAMFAHRNPKRVAIIGGGEGATLREVLKHRTVEKVVMVEIDGQMVKTSRKYLPGWSDCSNLIGSDIDCFKDPRVDLHILDAFQWFIDRFAEDGVLKGEEEPFDVIIMDALDPQIQKDFVEKLYEGGPFLKAIPDALSKDGIFIGQIGAADTIEDSGLNMALKNKNVVNFMQTLVDIGFESIIEYEEAHGGFGEIAWQFLVAMKSFDSRAGWFANEAGVNLKIRTRSMPTKTGESPFLYFDGATMLSYLHPSKGSEVVFCRGPGNCEDKHGFDPEIPNLALSETLEVKSISIDDKSRRGVFAKRDIPARSYIGLEKLVRAIYMSPYTISLMNAFRNNKIAWLWSIEALSQYLYEYGHSFSKYGKVGIAIDTSFRCFINHSCKGTNNVGHTQTQTTEDPGSIYQEFSDQYFGKERIINNPFAERQAFVFSGAIPNRDIQVGEELLDNCDCMAENNMELWKKDVLGLKDAMSGVGKWRSMNIGGD